MSGLVKLEPSIPSLLIRERINSQYGFQVSYRKTWMGKQKAIAQVFGEWDESFAKLPGWLAYKQMFASDFVYKIETIEFFINNHVDN